MMPNWTEDEIERQRLANVHHELETKICELEAADDKIYALSAELEARDADIAIFANAYPHAAFPEPPPGHIVSGWKRDNYSASMARHIVGRLLEQIAARKEEPE